MIIKYPDKLSEFEIHSELYNKLKLLWFDVRWEVTDTSIKKYCKNKKWFRKSRFDLVIFKDKTATHIIEVKNSKNHTMNTRQNIKYSMYNLPILYCMWLDDIELIIEQLH